MSAPSAGTARAALLVVDVQVDFTEGGSLPVPGGADCATAVGRYVRDHRDAYDLVVATQDWHVDPGAHFAGPDGPDFIDSWPVHCRVGTAGAALHPNMLSGLGADPGKAFDAVVRKGEHEAAYSGFQGRTEDGRALDEVLRGGGIDAVDVVGIASSHCVGQTALDALAAGYRTRVLSDLTVGVTAELERIAFDGVRAAGGVIEPGVSGGAGTP